MFVQIKGRFPKFRTRSCKYSQVPVPSHFNVLCDCKVFQVMMVIIIIVMCVCVLMMIVIMPIDNDTMGLLTGAGSSNSFPCPFITWVEQTYSTLVLGSTVMIIIKLMQPTR